MRAIESVVLSTQQHLLINNGKEIPAICSLGKVTKFHENEEAI